jgi:uncharacterized protein
VQPALDAAVLGALPIFPLREAVLLPRSLVPLHIFEPRYLAMTRDVVAGAGFLAIARLLPPVPTGHPRLRRKEGPGFEATYHGRPPVAPILGIGRLIAVEEAAEGRLNILLAGVARAAIERELPPARAYREVEARVLVDDETAEPTLLRHMLDQLVAVCDRLSEVLPAGGDELRQLSRVDDNPAASCDRVAGLLVTDADQRQALLEQTDPLRRTEAMLEHASNLLIAMSKPPTGPLN